MPFNLNRLSSKLMLANLLFSVVLAGAVAALVYLGFRQTQQNATARSAAGLADQGREALRQFTEREAEIADRQLQQAASAGAVAATYMIQMKDAGGQVPWSPDRLALAAEGQRYDPAPARRTDVWIGRDTAVTPQMEQDLRESAVFDALFPALLAESPDAIAIYYMSPAGMGRYYPVVDLVDRLAPDFAIAEQPFYALAAPAANPDRRTVWSPPYVDFVGLGPIVTASTPVYDGDAFRGVVSVDISLTQLIDRLNGLAPTAGGYAFLVDDDGRFVAASPRALSDLLGASSSAAEPYTITETLGLPLAQSENPQILATLSQMQGDVSGLVELELDGQTMLLAHAPLPVVDWELGMAAPLTEITAQSEAVAGAIRRDASETIQSTLLVLVALFLAALLVIAFVSRRLIVQRVEALAAGTEAIAAGDLEVRIPAQSEDELGQLAGSFNQMAGQLAAARDELEERVARRTRELAALYDVTAVASASLDLDTVLDQSLDRVLDVMECSTGAIHLLHDESHTLEMVTWRNVPAALWERTGRLAIGEGIGGMIAAQNEPIVLDDMANDPRSLPDVAVHVPGLRAYIGVPMRAKGEVVGVLSVVGAEARRFTAEETALMVSIGEQVGVAVENARLYRQAEALAVVQERQRLARELHDAVTQSVYSATLLAATGRRAVAAGDWEQAANFLDRLQTITGQALKELRLLVYELRPSALENAGLVEALQHRLDAVERRAGIQARLLVEDDIPLGEEQESALYRIVVEALNNALKHAEATAVTVRLSRQNRDLVLTVSDDGRGFEQTAVAGQGGVGLSSMRERAAGLGGDLVIDSELGEGTAVIIRLPEAQMEATHE